MSLKNRNNAHMDLTYMRTEVPYETAYILVKHNFGRSGPYLDMDNLRTACMDSIIVDDKLLYKYTRLDPEIFDFFAYLIWLRIVKKSHSRLMWEDFTRKSDAGNRCKLTVREALVVWLFAKRTNLEDMDLSGVFFISESSIYRYLIMIDDEVAEILPTARNLEQIIRAVYDKYYEQQEASTAESTERADVTIQEASTAESTERADVTIQESREDVDPYLVDIPPWQIFNRDVALSYMQRPPSNWITGGFTSKDPVLPSHHPGPALCLTDVQPRMDVSILMDGTHIPIEKYSDPTWNRLTFSGKAKAATYNTNLVTDPNGLALAMSPSVPGSRHDMRLFKENVPNFGYLTRVMLNANQPEGERPSIYLDKGYRSIHKILLGTNVKIPIMRGMGSDEDGEFSQQDRDHNREVAQVRYVVEFFMGWSKRYKILRGPYRGTPEECNEDLNIVTGLVNLKTLLKHIKVAHADTIRKVSAWRGCG